MNPIVIELHQLWLSVSFFMGAVFILCRNRRLRLAMLDEKKSPHSRMVLICLFSGIGIFGTVFGIPIGDAVINTRAAGVITGGLVGGPLVGAWVGAIAGLHRYFFMDTFTTPVSAAATVLQGIAAGLLSGYVRRQKPFLLWAFLTGVLLEILHGLVFFAMLGVNDRVLHLIRLMAPSMFLCNAAGVTLFMGMLHTFVEDHEKAVAHAARASFHSVTLMMEAMKSDASYRSFQNMTLIVMNSLPDLSWAAVLTGQQLQALTLKRWMNRQEARREIFRLAAMDKQDLPLHVLAFPIRSRDNADAFLLIRKDDALSFSAYEKEIGQGIIRVMEMAAEFHLLKKKDMLFHEAEIKMLQAQINPHFLFNALNTISHYCRKAPLQARKLVMYLADYYRQNLVEPNTMIPLEQEIHHVKAYVNLEKARFGERLSIRYLLPKQMIIVPALIMQPLVETAIIHGILPRKEGGRIRVSFLERPAEYILYVCDNGCGMEEDQVRSLLAPGAHRKSIGLINVHQRLRFIYGCTGGLRIISRKGKGTLVAFRIPKRGHSLR